MMRPACRMFFIFTKMKFHTISTFPTFSGTPIKTSFTGNQLPDPEMHGNQYRYKGIWVPRAGPKSVKSGYSWNFLKGGKYWGYGENAKSWKFQIFSLHGPRGAKHTLT